MEGHCRGLPHVPRESRYEAERNIRQGTECELGMPIYYLSDLVGLALGLEPERLGVNRHFVQRKG